MTMAASSLQNRLLLWAFLLSTILILSPVTAAEEGALLNDSSKRHLRRRILDVVDSTVAAVNNIVDKKEHTIAVAASNNDVGVEDVVVKSSHRILQTEYTIETLDESDSLDRTYHFNDMSDDAEDATTTTTSSSATPYYAHRRTQDIEDILNEMATKDPSEWSAVEWIVMILFLSFLGWLGCCLLTICCCGGCDTSNLLGWLCCWEICCRGGSDIDRCCDYALT
jgi:hypothetical protein